MREAAGKKQGETEKRAMIIRKTIGKLYLSSLMYGAGGRLRR